MNWLSTFKHLLPSGAAWRLTIEKKFRAFFDGLSGAPDDAKGYIDSVFDDIDPYKTTSLNTWESQFGLPNALLNDTQRRDRLAATWRFIGGQTPAYIQATLQAAGFPVYVHDWWETGTNPPVARDPFDYLNDGTFATYTSVDGAAGMNDGAAGAQDGKAAAPSGYPLVNSLLEYVGGEFQRVQYIMPTDPATFPFYLYLGGATFGDQAVIPSSRKSEFEELALKICPTQLWIGVIVRFA